MFTSNAATLKVRSASNCQIIVSLLVTFFLWGFRVTRHYTFLDRLCLGVDNALRALSNTPHTTGIPNPAGQTEDTAMTEQERRHAAGLMRINHTGEICAQGLYHGQGLVSRCAETQQKMHNAAIEEGDHLSWCKERLDELHSHTSYLNPIWYAGSFVIGAAAGFMGDKWSLGFVAETEKQVINHLDSHLEKLPAGDRRSLKILEKMQVDEAKHRQEAIDAGAKELPGPVKLVMNWSSKIMVKTTYWI